jgi:hypothetical protein
MGFLFVWGAYNIHKDKPLSLSEMFSDQRATGRVLHSCWYLTYNIGWAYSWGHVYLYVFFLLCLLVGENIPFTSRGPL